MLGACSTGGPEPRISIRVVDFVRRFGQAETRPASGRFGLAQHTLGGTLRASIDVPVPSRTIWSIPIPRRATLNALAGVLPASVPAIVRFRVGVSDDRIYEELVSHTVIAEAGREGGWAPIQADLSAYAGWQWSIFFRPERRAWRVVLSTDAVEVEGAGNRAIWGEPGIDTDLAAARHFVHERLGYRGPNNR